jgi:hypothetical protein
VHDITTSSLEELINRITFLYRKYTKITFGDRSYDVVAVDPADYRKKRDFIQSLTFNLIVLAKPGQKLVKGSDFVRSALKSNYIVINPHTKELCVSFCIATL